MSVLTVQACYVAAELYGHDCGGLTHGGEIEALAVLAYRPDLVHLDRIDYSSDHAHGRKWDRLRRTRSYQPVLRDIRTIAPTGWYGAPEHATVGEGPEDAERHRGRDREGSDRDLPHARRGAGRHGGDQAPEGGDSDGEQ